MEKAPPPHGTAEYQNWLNQALDSNEAADFLGVARAWLERARIEGSGPKFHRLSPKVIVYQRKQLILFMESKSHTATAEYAHAVPDGDASS